MIRRGLSRRAELRYPSLTVLLDALRPPSRRGRRGAAAVGLVLGVAATLLWVNAGNFDPRSQCSSSESRLAGVWDQDVRARVDETVRGSALPYADHVATRVTELLDDRARQWADEHTEACRASGDRGEQTADVLDRRMRCLSDHRRAIAATTRALTSANTPDRAAVEHAAVHARNAEHASVELGRLDEASTSPRPCPRRVRRYALAGAPRGRGPSPRLRRSGAAAGPTTSRPHRAAASPSDRTRQPAAPRSGAPDRGRARARDGQSRSLAGHRKVRCPATDSAQS